MVTMAKTTQIGLRLDKELLDKINNLSEHEGIDRMSWIRRALACFVNETETAMSDDAIDDYINLRIDEKALKEFTNYSKIPEDIQKARKSKLESISSSKK